MTPKVTAATQIDSSKPFAEMRRAFSFVLSYLPIIPEIYPHIKYSSLAIIH